MTRRPSTLAFLAALLAAAALSACGDEDSGEPIPRDTADTLTSRLDAFQQDMNSGAICPQVDPRIRELEERIALLDNQGVAGEVQNAIGDGVNHLRSLAVDTCGEADRDDDVETTPETTPTTPPETTTTPTPTTTTPVPTTTTPTPTTPTPPSDGEIEPDEGDGGEQFEPDGDGNGGGIPPGQAKKLEDGR